jgi:hypothetical protein
VKKKKIKIIDRETEQRWLKINKKTVTEDGKTNGATYKDEVRK